MDRLQYLLIKLAEEASEVSQIALKTAQFGMSEVSPFMPGQDNRSRVHSELNDLLGVVDRLNEEFGFEFTQSAEASEDKKLKLNKYYRYSKNSGMVT